MTVQFYTFSKKPNSTKWPSSGGHVTDCEIFEPCSITSPVIILAGEDPEGWNYAWIPAWSRYYWVNNWERSGGRWFGSLEVDPLASWRGDIGESVQYITRAAARSDGTITDNLYVTKNPPIYGYQTQPSPWDLTAGTYVVGVGGGQTQFYALTQGQFGALMSYIFSDAYADEVVGGVWSDIYPELKARLNPLQYISSVTWFPLAISGSPVSSIPVGWVNCPVSGGLLLASALTNEVVSFTIPKHPQSGERGSYLNSPPYSQYHLFFPPWGVIQLNSDFCAGHTSFDARAVIDCKTGFALLKIESGQVQSCIVQTKVGVPIQLAQITAPGTGLYTVARDVMQLTQSGLGTIGTAASAAMSGNPASMASGLLSAASSAIGTLDQAAGMLGQAAENCIPSINSIGSSGGMGGLTGVPTLFSQFYQVVDADLANKGAPLCQIAQVSSLPGFQVIANPHLEIEAFPSEIASIYNYLKGGYYYE